MNNRSDLSILDIFALIRRAAISHLFPVLVKDCLEVELVPFEEGKGVFLLLPKTILPEAIRTEHELVDFIYA